MKKSIFIISILFIMSNLQAQWVDNPAVNTLIASGDTYYDEIRISTHEASGHTFVQWIDLKNDRMNPSMQMIDVNGVPQWGNDGIVVNSNPNLDYTDGFSMVATADGCAVSHFTDRRSGSLSPYAVKLDADANFVWGENGIHTFDIQGFGIRTGIYADHDGGVWVTACNDENAFVRHINADGTTDNTITISESGYCIFFPKIVVCADNSILLVYQKGQHASSYFYNKELYVAKYAVDGTLLHAPELLMSSVNAADWLESYVVADAQGGGYAIMWHRATGPYETYVFHFDAEGNNTLGNTQGVNVTLPDDLYGMANFHYHAYGTVDPISNDLFIAWKEADSDDEVYNAIEANRITQNGEKLWGDAGITLVPTTDYGISEVKADILPNGNGAVVTYVIGGYSTPQLKAVSIDGNGLTQWQTDMSTSNHAKVFAQNNDGFHNGQLILVWSEERGNTGLYVQNIQPNGAMGPLPEPCFPPTNFQGTYLWDEDSETFGAMLTWNAPEETPLHYNLYREDLASKEAVTIEIPSSETAYFDEVGTGNYRYQLTAIHEDCESEYALTPEGQNGIEIAVTSVNEHHSEVIVKVTNVYNMAGQSVRCHNLEELDNGIYIIQGETENGSIVCRKHLINK